MDDHEIYAGLSNIKIPTGEYDLGEGIFLSSTYCCVIAPYMVALNPAQPGKPHPTPWYPMRGGHNCEMYCQCYIPKEYKPIGWFDRLNTVWLITSLLRLQYSKYVRAAVITSCPFGSISNGDVLELIPVEDTRTVLSIGEFEEKRIAEEEILWIKIHWQSTANLLQNTKFNLLYQAFDRTTFTHNVELAFLQLWSGLEALFSPSDQGELRFRISSNIATFIINAGEQRNSLRKK